MASSLAMFVYREMTVADFLRAVRNTAALTGVLLFIFTAASAFSWVLTIAYLPQRLVDLLAAGHGNTTIFMIGSIALLIFVGVLLEACRRSMCLRLCCCRSPSSWASAACTSPLS